MSFRHNGILYETLDSLASALDAENSTLKLQIDVARQAADIVLAGVVKERDDALRLISEAMSACRVSGHETNHTEPKHCVAALLSIIEQMGPGKVADRPNHDHARGVCNEATCEECKNLKRVEGSPKCKCDPCDCPDCKRIGAVCRKCDQPV